MKLKNKIPLEFKTQIFKISLIALTIVLSLSTFVFAAGQGEPAEPGTEITDCPTSLLEQSPSVIWQTVKQYITENGLKILTALVIFLIGRWLAGYASLLIAKTLRRAKIEETLIKFIKSLSYITMLVFVVIIALAWMGVQTASFVALLGAAGLAVGLALQGSLANFASGVLLLIFKPIKVGDFVEAGNAMGTVKEIGIFITILNSIDNIRIIIPNSQITGNNIRNFTVNGTRRIDMVIGVSYEDNLQKTKKVIEKVLAADKRILAEPNPVVAVSELGDSSVNFVVRPWVNSSDYWTTKWDLTEKIKVELEKNGLTIPFPQRDVHMKNDAPQPTPVKRKRAKKA